MTTVEKLGGKRLSPSDRKILRLLINAGWRLRGWRAPHHPWVYELKPPAGTGVAAVTVKEADVRRMSMRGLLELREMGGPDEHWLGDSLAGRRAFKSGLLEQPLEQSTFLDTPKPKRGRNAVDR